jgi:1-phosphofructokinase family hexose kinase
MIFCVTPNPALDHTLTIPRLRPGEVMRAEYARLAAGGKGLNVARAICALGGEPACLGFLGGHTGRLLADLAQRDGLRGEWTWINGETRTCVIVVSAEGGDATVINEQGPPVTGADWARFNADMLQAVTSTASPSGRFSFQQSIICFSGSLPPGSPPESWEHLLRSLQSAGHSVWVDTSGEALRAALHVAGLNVKVNGAEAGAALGREVHDPASAIEAANELRLRGASNVALTLGKHGAVLVNEIGVNYAPAPPVKVVNTVGSGDSFLAGLATALSQGKSPAEALYWGVAAGTANAASSGGAHFTRDEFQAALASIEAQHRLGFSNSLR